MATFVQPRFVQTRRFFQTELHTLPSRKPKVFAVFQRYSDFRPDEARQVLRVGITPKVRVARLPGRYGFTPPRSEEIWLGRTFIGEFEALLDEDTVTGVYDRYTVREKAHRLLEATVLHELVHWCRRKVHGYNPNQVQEEAIAQRFEREAYGMLVDARSVGLAQHMPRMAGPPADGAPTDVHPRL